LLASFWVLAHEPQQSMVITHITTATAYDSTMVMSVLRCDALADAPLSG
jgi:hypothetical protein